MFFILFFKNLIKKNYSEIIFLLLFFFYTSLIFIYSEGTQNTNTQSDWVDHANKIGIIDGYKKNINTYPPFITVILKCFFDFLNYFTNDVKIFYGIKLAIFFFFFLSTFIIYFYTSNLKLTIFFILTFLISSIGLNDLDIIFAPFLILSIIFLKKKKLFFFSLFYCISILIKWQPIIIAPIFLIFISKYNWKDKINFISIKKYFNNIKICLVPIFLIFLIIFISYGFLPLAKSLYKSVTNNWLSGNALNFNWILTWFLKTYDSINYQPIIDGKINWIKINSFSFLAYSGKILFILTYITLIIKFINCKKKNIQNLLFFSATISFCYYILNTGVHQNHLFLSTLLFILAFNENKKFFIEMLATSIIFNINLFIFYGVTGTGLVNTVINKSFDLTIIISLLNIIFLIKLILSSNYKYLNNK
jgi:hypothetical protein